MDAHQQSHKTPSIDANLIVCYSLQQLSASLQCFKMQSFIEEKLNCRLIVDLTDTACDRLGYARLLYHCQ